MKPLRMLTLVVALAVVVGAAASRPAEASVSFGFFYSNLSPHGSWVVSGSYGRVWQPAVYRAGWNPYYDGHWVSTDVGWSWDSDYAWGAIPYHYGTWVMDPGYGWVWIPGYTWAPSWVAFRQGPDYIGWAPVAPSFSVGISFHGGFPAPPLPSFVFVHSHDFLCDRVRGYAVPYSQANVIVNRTKIVNNNIRIENNVVVNRGPDVKFVERATRRRVSTIPVSSTRSVRELGARGVTRADLRAIDHGGRGLRAAEPVSASRPLPTSRAVHNDRLGGRSSVQDRNDRFDRRAQPDRRFAPESRPAPERRAVPDRRSMVDRRPEVERRSDVDRRSDAERRFAPDRRPAPDRRSQQDRRPAPDRRSMPNDGPRVREGNGDHDRSRPDEGRMFRGVREHQPGPSVDRRSAQRPDRMNERSQPSSTSRSRGGDRSRRSSDRSNDRPKEQKKSDHN